MERFRHFLKSIMLFGLVGCSQATSSSANAAVNSNAVNNPSIQAIRSPQGAKEYCEMVKNKETFLQLLSLEESRLAFYNPGGFFNIGLCWWHSRLQRSSLYLAVYEPEKPRQSRAVVLQILDALYNQRYVVSIKGYRNFNEFTRANKDVIIQYLSTSQVLDSLEGEWTAGAIGTSILPSGVLQKLMDNLYKEFNSKRDVTYQMLQMPGMEAHAWLVTGMVKTRDGYDIYHVDSNAPLATNVMKYKIGDTYLNYYGTRFVPYTKEQGKMSRAWQLAKSFCK